MNLSLYVSTKKVIKPNSLEPIRKHIEIIRFYFYEKFIVAAHVVVFVLIQITIKFEIVISWNTYCSVKWKFHGHVVIMREKMKKFAVVPSKTVGH